MPLLSLRNIVISHGGPPLIKNINLIIKRGERVCLVGRNGVGKSTLLKLIQGEVQADSGTIERAQGLKIATLIQEVPRSMHGNVSDIVASALSDHHEEPWQIDYKVATILSKLELDGELSFDDLSGGLKRRVLLAKALVAEPDLLLLDEPTNHLDIDAIKWLENFLLNFNKTLLFITHDRVIMQKVGTHIVEIDKGRLISWHGHYEDYLKHREAIFEAEARADVLFDKRLAQEEIWIRQGIKARRTRNEGRVRDLKKMRETRSQRRMAPGQVQLSHQKVEKSGKIVFDVSHISHQYDDEMIINDFSTVIMRGDKIGLIGPNGSGKSTFLNCLLGKIKPSSGCVKHGTKLTVSYYDQQREQLEEDKNVLDNVSEGTDFITIGDQTKHIMSYLQDFLFAPDRARTPVRSLSGGERNRVMLAKLFSKPGNVLVLDEPTNDLDVETLELLEDQLLNYSGTLLLVSHDRAFLNNIVTSVMVMEEGGKIGEYVGGYDDWLRQIKASKSASKSKAKTKAQSKQQAQNSSEKSKLKSSKKESKLSFSEKHELKSLPSKLENLEKEQKELQTKFSDPAFFNNNPDDMVTSTKRLKEIEEELEKLYSRWNELENL